MHKKLLQLKLENYFFKLKKKQIKQNPLPKTIKKSLKYNKISIKKSYFKYFTFLSLFFQFKENLYI